MSKTFSVPSTSDGSISASILTAGYVFTLRLSLLIGTHFSEF